MTKTIYRPEIDGIRAVAILAVIFFHYNIYPFSGGYLGVDVFLVISGYLITSFIIPKLSNNFNFSEFFFRRIKRLLPTYYVTLLLSLIFAYYLFSPDDLNKFAKSSINSILFLSNFYFWANSGYWDESNTNPLLHTWTLSLEWQFYFFISIFLFIGWRFCKKKLNLLILILFCISLFLSVLYIGRDVSFFLIPFRLFEFLIGSYIFIHKNNAKIFYKNNFLSFFGLLLIIFSFIYFDSFSNIPGYLSLIPCLGTAILLYQDSSYVHQILSNKKIVYIGLISYSLYLLHWPIIIFYNSFNIIELKLEIKILLLVFTIFLSILNYEIIEKKIRKSIFKFVSVQSVLLFLVLPIIILILNFFIINKNGIPERFPKEKTKFLTLFKNENETRINYLSKNIDLKFDKNYQTKILVLGDSHGRDLFMALKQNINRNYSIDIEYLQFSHWCFEKNKFRNIFFFLERIKKRIKKCDDEKLKFIDNSNLLKEADIIILSSSWYKGIDTYIEDIYLYLNKFSKAKIIVSSKTIFFPKMTSLLIKMDTDKMNEINQLAYKIKYKEQDLINSKLEKKLKKINVTFLNKSDLICNDQSKTCKIFNNSNKQFYIFNDGSHWTLEGAKYYGKKIDFNIFK